MSIYNEISTPKTPRVNSMKIGNYWLATNCQNKNTYNPWLNMLYYLEQMEGCEVSQHSDLLNDLNNKSLTKMLMNLAYM